METTDWLCVVDESTARLVRVTARQGESPNAAELEWLPNAWEPHELGRFAHDVVAWLGRSVIWQRIARITVRAEPPLMDELRRCWTDGLRDRVREEPSRARSDDAQPK